MGLFREPMIGFHGRSREDFAVALAVQAAGMAAMASAPNPSWLVPTAGLVIGLVQALTAFAIVLAAFAQLSLVAAVLHRPIVERPARPSPPTIHHRRALEPAQLLIE